jgi:hypothetical protein
LNRKRCRRREGRKGAADAWLAAPTFDTFQQNYNKESVMKIASTTSFAPAGAMWVLDRLLSKRVFQPLAALGGVMKDARSSLEAKNRFSIINHQKKSERTHTVWK